MPIEINSWYIEDNFNGEWAVVDDDDNDGWLDGKFNNNFYYSYLQYDGEYKEYESSVLPQYYNRNNNGIPDYEEDFLLFYSDRYFLGNILFDDANYNSIIDIEENDNDPDFPYDRNRTGLKGLLGFNFYKFGTFYAGGIYNQHISDKFKYSKAYTFAYLLDIDLFNFINIGFQHCVERVKDFIEDDFIGKSGGFIDDMLFYKNNVLSKLIIKLSFIYIDDLTFEIKGREDYTKSKYEDFKNTLSTYVFKLGYDFKLCNFLKGNATKKVLNFIISPQLKFEKCENILYYKGVEMFISEIEFLNQRKANNKALYAILKLKYIISDYFYFISGIQYSRRVDYNLNANSYNGFHTIFQFVLLGKLKGWPISLTTGIKYGYIKFNMGRRRSFEYFLKSMIKF